MAKSNNHAEDDAMAGISIHEMLAIDVCHRYDEARLSEIYGEREELTVGEVLDLTDPYVTWTDKITVALECGGVSNDDLNKFILRRIPNPSKHVKHLVKVCESAIGAIALLAFHHEAAETDPSEDYDAIATYIKEQL